MILNFIKNLYYFLTGRNISVKEEVNIDASWYGNGYGGFYVFPQILDKNSIVYSFGIGEDVSFDLEVIKNHGCNVYGFDPTPKSIDWVNQQHLPKEFQFFPFGISTLSGFETFYLPKNDENVSGSILGMNNVNTLTPIQVPMKNMEDIIGQLNHAVIDLLKMDIEGAEYDVIKNILGSKIEIKQICIEFHHRMFSGGGRKTMEAIDLLQQHGYQLFKFSNTHEELSFIKKPYIAPFI
jgi:FkbM family methyltransferase